jgi:hypothetical protein
MALSAVREWGVMGCDDALVQHHRGSILNKAPSSSAVST